MYKRINITLINVVLIYERPTVQVSALLNLLHHGHKVVKTALGGGEGRCKGVCFLKEFG